MLSGLLSQTGMVLAERPHANRNGDGGELIVTVASFSVSTFHVQLLLPLQLCSS